MTELERIDRLEKAFDAMSAALARLQEYHIQVHGYLPGDVKDHE